MTRITVLGGTGYAGSNIVREAASRGHQVTAISRSVPEQQIPGVTYVAADVLDPATLDQAVAGADVVVEALSPRGALEGKLQSIVRDLAAVAQSAGARLGVVGGAGSLLVAPGGPALANTPDFPDAFKGEAGEMAAALEDLRASDDALDWFFVSPAASFGAWAPGEHTGTFRLGGDVLLTDEAGNSTISGADLAHAFVDEIERPAHRRTRFTVAY
ncbi:MULTISPECIES: NAD(P)-dependent oxidoreductase [unclassified Leucobacter]|uniref:NAD(P)-dependent oxidoreductase n=1 Tax=unclassified Leucobacter TaxID=2621730 RepID=UPI00165E6A18|nr:MULTISPECIES: NAD(P)H-binding protein [unclassified Leucobacter]MBC9935950.1 NAD(P)H-binding protein [Leucobacter sp. cx-87]